MYMMEFIEPLPETLIEKIDVKRVEYLNSILTDDLFATSVDNTVEEQDMKIGRLKNYITKLKKQNGIFKAVYSKSLKDNLEIGRSYGTGIQGIPRVFRGFLCEGIVTDIDIVNCFPVILKHVCDSNCWNCPYLTAYCENRDILIQSKQVPNKTSIMCSWNSKEYLKTTSDFLTKLDIEIKGIQQLAMKCEQFKPIMESVITNKKKNIIGSFMTMLLTSFENKILMVICDYLKKNGYDLFALMFDGVMIYGDYSDMDSLSNLVLHKLGIRVNFMIKPHATQLKIPSDWNYNNPKIVYETLKYKYEHDYKLAFIEMSTCYSIIIDGKLCFKSREDIKQHLYPVTIATYSKPVKFFDQWLEDETRQTFARVDIIPHDKPCPENVLNLWNGFAVERITDYTPVDIEPILNHIRIMMNHDNKCVEFILNWMANIFQYPSSPSVLVNIVTEKGGTGKGTLVDIIHRLIGTDLYHFVDDVSTKLFHRFNGDLRGKVLVHMDESSAKDLNQYYERLKAMITSESYIVEDKGQKPITISNILKYISTTQNLHAFKIKEGDRRIVSIEGSEELRDNFAYFDRFNEIINDPNYQRSFYNFLMSRKVKQRITHQDFPETQLMRDAKILNRDPVEDFIEELDYEEYTSDNLYLEYCNYIKSSGFEFIINKKQFKMKFSKLTDKYKIIKKCIDRIDTDERGNKTRVRNKIYKKTLDELN